MPVPRQNPDPTAHRRGVRRVPKDCERDAADFKSAHRFIACAPSSGDEPWARVLRHQASHFRRSKGTPSQIPPLIHGLTGSGLCFTIVHPGSPPPISLGVGSHIRGARVHRSCILKPWHARLERCYIRIYLATSPAPSRPQSPLPLDLPGDW